MPSTSYKLSPEELQMMNAIRISIVNAKVKIYDLQSELEGARKQFEAASANLVGAMSILAHSKGIRNPSMTEDLTTINGDAAV